jgi:hypothetical protein
LARTQAALVALLYVFLSTFGTLTHTHAWIGGEVDTDGTVTSSASPIVAQRPAVAHHFTADTHCAFCDWQANSVSTALPLQHCVVPCFVALSAPRQVVISVTVRIVQSSSRAPPCV